jgi:hypothetical protein
MTCACCGQLTVEGNRVSLRGGVAHAICAITSEMSRMTGVHEERARVLGLVRMIARQMMESAGTPGELTLAMATGKLLLTWLANPAMRAEEDDGAPVKLRQCVVDAAMRDLFAGEAEPVATTGWKPGGKADA